LTKFKLLLEEYGLVIFVVERYFDHLQ